MGIPTGSGTLNPKLGYRGELTSKNLINLRARNYQPITGQFLTTDPLQGVNSTPTVANPYHYGYNDPLNQTDPSGMRPNEHWMFGLVPILVPVAAGGAAAIAELLVLVSGAVALGAALAAVLMYVWNLDIPYPEGFTGTPTTRGEYQRDLERQNPKPLPSTAPNGDPLTHRGRAHVQGPDVDENDPKYSWSWARQAPPTAAEGLAGIAGLKAALTKSQLRPRARMFEKAVEKIRRCQAAGGCPTQRWNGSDYVSKPAPKDEGKRLDIEILAGVAFV